MAQTDQQFIDYISQDDAAEAGIFNSTVGQNAVSDDLGNPDVAGIDYAYTPESDRIVFEANGTMSPPSTTSAGQAGTTSSSTGNKPGKRTYNPLSKFSSYTYSATLYMITTDAYLAFVDSDRKNIGQLASMNGSGGAFVVAQSAGVNNSMSKRAPGFENDHYIDNISMDFKMPGAGTQSAVAVTDIKFDIIEPYGFSLVSRMSAAMSKLQGHNESLKLQKNPIRQFFILGIRFQGYDSAGKVVTKESDLGEQFLGATGSGGVFEYFYDISLNSMKMKFENKATVYSCTARMVTDMATFGKERGYVHNTIQVYGDTVREMIKDLEKKLNNEEERLKKLGRAELVNEIKFDLEGFSELANARVVTEQDKDKRRSQNTDDSIKTKTDVNESGLATKTSTAISSRFITINASTPIQQALLTIIKESDFLKTGLKKVQKVSSKNEPKDQIGSKDDTVQEDGLTLRWFNVTPRITDIKVDNLRNSYTYSITYLIRPYDIPYVVSSYVNKSLGYYGPYKIYNYYWTGQNDEVLNYQVNFDNLFHNVALNPDRAPSAHGGSAAIPTFNNVMSRVTANESNKGNNKDAENSVINVLYDPGAFAKAKLSILGDPDYFMQTSSIKQDLTRSANLFYGADGYSINPSGGQCFIEVIFNEPKDYNIQKGTMTPNQALMFFLTPAKSNIKGISHIVHNIKTTLSGGKFTQTLDLALNVMPGEDDQTNNRSPNATGTGTNNLTPDISGDDGQDINEVTPLPDFDGQDYNSSPNDDAGSFDLSTSPI